MPATWNKLAYDAEVVKHALSTAANDFLVASGAGAFIKKTLAETRTILSLPALNYAVGDLLYASSTTMLAKLADVAVGSVLVSGGIGAAPAWSAAPSITTSLTVPLILAPAAALAIRPTTDATTAIQLQDKDGNSILNVDTVNNRIGIGTVAPDAKLQVHDGSIYLSDTDVAHGMISYVPTDVFGGFSPHSSTSGGLRITGFSDTDWPGMLVYGVIGATSPTNPAVVINGAKKDGTVCQAMGSTEQLLQVWNDGSAVLTILGSGNVGIGTVAPRDVCDVVGGLTITSKAFSIPGYGTGIEINHRTSDGNGYIVSGTRSAGAYVYTPLNISASHIILQPYYEGNVSIGGFAVRGTTVGLSALNIFDGTAPAGTLTNGCSIFSTGGALGFMDSAGNAMYYGAGKLGVGGSPVAYARVYVAGSLDASGGAATGIWCSVPLVATANNDILTGVYLGSGFTNGAFSGVTNYDLYAVGTVSAGTLVDRTPYFEGDAITALMNVKGHKDGDKKGQIDHSTLPEFARYGKNERNIGAMISILTVAIQQQQAQIEALQAQLN